MPEYLKGKEYDHIVEQKIVETAYNKNEHIVTLKYFPPIYYDDDHDKVFHEKQEEWWVEIDVGGCFNEMYHNEKSARMSYDLIDRSFCINVENWHMLRNSAENFRRTFMDLHSIQIFEGKK